MQNNLQFAYIRFPRNILKYDIVTKCEHIKLKIKNKLNQSEWIISSISDLQMLSNQYLGYLCANSHYINFDCQLKMKILACHVLEYPHNEATIYQELAQIFTECEIS